MCLPAFEHKSDVDKCRCRRGLSSRKPERVAAFSAILRRMQRALPGRVAYLVSVVPSAAAVCSTIARTIVSQSARSTP
jgi:hypothetical protein